MNTLILMPDTTSRAAPKPFRRGRASPANTLLLIPAPGAGTSPLLAHLFLNLLAVFCLLSFAHVLLLPKNS